MYLLKKYVRRKSFSHNRKWTEIVLLILQKVAHNYDKASRFCVIKFGMVLIQSAHCAFTSTREENQILFSTKHKWLHHPRACYCFHFHHLIVTYKYIKKRKPWMKPASSIEIIINVSCLCLQKYKLRDRIPKW